jgi:hypothetical protein
MPTPTLPTDAAALLDQVCAQPGVYTAPEWGPTMGWSPDRVAAAASELGRRGLTLPRHRVHLRPDCPDQAELMTAEYQCARLVLLLVGDGHTDLASMARAVGGTDQARARAARRRIRDGVAVLAARGWAWPMGPLVPSEAGIALRQSLVA